MILLNCTKINKNHKKRIILFFRIVIYLHYIAKSHKNLNNQKKRMKFIYRIMTHLQFKAKINKNPNNQKHKKKMKLIYRILSPLKFKAKNLNKKIIVILRMIKNLMNKILASNLNYKVNNSKDSKNKSQINLNRKVNNHKI